MGRNNMFISTTQTRSVAGGKSAHLIAAQSAIMNLNGNLLKHAECTVESPGRNLRNFYCKFEVYQHNTYHNPNNIIKFVLLSK